MDTDLVSLRGRGGIATLTLQHPTKPNPLTLELQAALLERVAEVAADPSVRALLVTASGRAFCVGADLGELTQARPNEAHATRGDRVAWMMQTLTNPIVQALRALPVPVLCAVNGAAAGAGVGLALACDIVLMARSAYFYLPFIPRLGIIPDMGSSWFLHRLAGRGRAMALAVLGERVGADEAVRLGLAWASVDDASLPDEAAQLARRLAALPAGAALEARRLFDAADRNSLEYQLAHECERQRELINSPSFDEGVRAFMEKRDPVFGGPLPES
jgi:2-(1,2-epoxy-1,2-dihydrophenyl)acetyl-CoA isomerase